MGQAVLLDVPAATCPALLERLEQFIITEDVALQDWSARLARLALHGPGAPGALAGALRAGEVPH